MRLLLKKRHAGAEKPEAGPGRPTAYKIEFCGQATALCKLGAVDADLANFFGVNEATIYRWKADHPEFAEAIRAGKIIADMTVAERLYGQATGFEYEEAQAVKLKDVQYSPDGKKIAETERVEIVQVRKIVPPRWPPSPCG